MATDLTVVLEDKPGTLAQLGETWGKRASTLVEVVGSRAQGKV